MDNILSIDLNALETEWINQPKLFFKYAKQLAGMKEKLDEVKGVVDLTKAELDSEIRENPEGFGIAKITETAISSAIIKSPKMLKKQVELRTIKHEADILQAVVTALEQRKSALENLVKLHGQNYFSTPVASGESKEAIETEKRKAVRKRIRDRLNGDDE
uniref:Uncharacterized protein n=1 Tax=viral metagenome TaxID=1070528 RepID=A0A6M3IPR3_9ZZZZ